MTHFRLQFIILSLGPLFFLISSLIFKNICLGYSCLTMLYQFLLHSKVNQLYVYLYPLLFGFPSHLGHHRNHKALSRVPCAIWQVLIIQVKQLSISYIVSIVYTCQYTCQYMNLSVHPSPIFLTLYPCTLCLCLYLYAAFESRSSEQRVRMLGFTVHKQKCCLNVWTEFLR